jgi:hypothetical protein
VSQVTVREKGKMNRRMFLAVVAACCLAVPAARATVLTFQGLGTNTNIPDGYGDNVAAVGPAIAQGNGFTPNVIVDFLPNGGNGFQTYNDPDWQAAQLDGSPPNGNFDIVFTPAPGYGVRVNSFEFDDYANYELGHTFNWSVFLEEGTDLAGAADVVVDPDTTEDPSGADNLVINTGLTDFIFGPVTLRIQPTSGDPFDRAIDDINFDQVAVPEPGTLGVIVVGAGALGLRRRRVV